MPNKIDWESNILGFIPKKDWLDIEFRINRPGDPADELLDDRKTENLVAEWQSIAAEYQIPVMANFHGFDTEAQKTIREPVDNHNIEKGLIKVKIDQSERMRALLRSGVNGDERLYEYVIRDGVRLAEQVITRTKVAKNELLATGQVTIKENNLDLTVDYGVPAANKAHTLDFGAGATDSIPDQLQSIVSAAKASGTILSGIFTSSNMVLKLRKNEAIQRMINGNSGVGIIVRNTDLADFLNDEFGIGRIIQNDYTYRVNAEIGSDGRPSGDTEFYYPRDKITFFSANNGGKLGTGLWGDPPETDVARLLDVAGSGVSPYVYITQWAENDPAVLWTKASALFMPVLFNPNSLRIASASETPAGA
jgi:hypothetical protein